MRVSIYAYLVCAAAIAAPGHAAQSVAPVPPSGAQASVASVPEPKAPVRLELRLQPGLSQRYRVTDDTLLRATLPNGGVRRSNTATESVFEMSVDRANPDGSYEIRVRPVSQNVTVNGRDVTPSEASRAEATATLARDGRLSNLSPQTADKAERDGAMSAKDFLETLFDEDAGFPSRALGIGDGWKDQVDSPLDDRGTRVTVNNTLLALDILDGKPVARLLNVVAEPVQVPPDEDGVTMTGKLEGGGLTTVDLQTGLLVSGGDTVRLKMSVSAPIPGGDARVNVDSEASIKVRVQALPPDMS